MIVGHVRMEQHAQELIAHSIPAPVHLDLMGQIVSRFQILAQHTRPVKIKALAKLTAHPSTPAFASLATLEITARTSVTHASCMSHVTMVLVAPSALQSTPAIASQDLLV